MCDVSVICMKAYKRKVKYLAIDRVVRLPEIIFFLGERERKMARVCRI